MSANIIQADYEALDRVAARFAAQAEIVQQQQQRIERQVAVLEGGSWLGRGIEAFSNEMRGEVFPAVERLHLALAEAQQVTLAVSATIRAAEEEARVLFDRDGSDKVAWRHAQPIGDVEHFNPNVMPRNLLNGRDDDGDGYPDIPYYQLDMDMGGVLGGSDWNQENLDSMYTLMRELDTNGRPVIFAVHGYNVLDDAASSSYGQFVDSIHDKYAHLPADQRPVVIGVNWDGEGHLLGSQYLPANTNAENTGRYVLNGLMSTYYQNHPESAINVIAHSLGNRVVMSAIGDGSDFKINEYIAMEAAVGTGNNNIQTNYAGVVDSSAVEHLTITYTNADIPLNLHEIARHVPNFDIRYDGIDLDLSTRPDIDIDLLPVEGGALGRSEGNAMRLVESRNPGSTTLVNLEQFAGIGMNHPGFTDIDVLNHTLETVMPNGENGWI